LLPALFVSHGAPTVALEKDDYARALADFGARTTRPEAVIVVSAHWEAVGPVRVNTVDRPGLIYDFAGFPREMYSLDYPAPGAPALAVEVLRRLGSAGVDAVAEAKRGWDHGVWVPLRLLYADAAIPVLELSLPVPRDPERLFRIGQALGPMRTRGALIVGSGGIVHNLSLLRWSGKEAAVDEWARAFDDWVNERLEGRVVEELLQYRLRAPHADLAVPTSEHFDPLFFVLGATSEGERPSPVFSGFQYGNLSMRTVAFGG